MTLKLNSSSSGSVSFVAPASTTAGADINLALPVDGGTVDRLERAGNIVQVKAATPVYGGSIISCTKTTATAAALYGLTANRAYADLLSVTITPQSASNTLIFLANVGYDIGTQSNKGAHGVVIVRDNTLGLEINGSYPWYDALVTKPDYSPPDYVSAVYSASNTNAQTWYLKSFCYNEADGNSSEITNCISRSFVVLEIAA